MGKTVTTMKQLTDLHLAAISDTVKGLTKEVHNRALEYVLEQINSRVELIERLLDNGDAILATAYGDRWKKIYDKRHELFMKKWELYEVERIIFDSYIR